MNETLKEGEIAFEATLKFEKRSDTNHRVPMTTVRPSVH